jgi:hypothetical protein
MAGKNIIKSAACKRRGYFFVALEKVRAHENRLPLVLFNKVIVHHSNRSIACRYAVLYLLFHPFEKLAAKGLPSAEKPPS